MGGDGGDGRVMVVKVAMFVAERETVFILVFHLFLSMCLHHFDPCVYAHFDHSCLDSF